MRKLLFSILLCTLFNAVFSQSDWVTKDLGNNITIKFPSTPTYKLTDKIGSYSAKTEICLFIASIFYDAVPHYSELVKLPINQQEKLIEILLDNVVNGLLIQASKEGTPFKKTKVGKNSAREVSYDFMNPVTGNETTNYSKFFYSLGKVYMLQTYSYKDNMNCSTDRNFFLNSITIKQSP